MSNLFSGFSRFRGANKSGGQQVKSPVGNGPQSSSPTSSSPTNLSSSSLAPRMPPVQTTPSLSRSMSMDDGSDLFAHYNISRPLPVWLNNSVSKHIVKGNFMTLSARPKTVEAGEWLAHQAVEQFRVLGTFIKVIHDKNEDGATICNSQTCPKMSAGANHSFTWLNARKEPVEVAAHEYISLMSRWISTKFENTSIFPTDPAGASFANNPGNPGVASSTYASGGLNTPSANTPIPAGPTTLNASLSALSGPGDWVGKSSGFPQEFVDICQLIFRQMFRVYAHLYWAHYIDPFWHLNLEKSLNSCFSHFVLTATALDMLKPSDLEPMQPLVDLWAANGTFPPESKAYEYANLPLGQKLLSMATPA